MYCQHKSGQSSLGPFSSPSKVLYCWQTCERDRRQEHELERKNDGGLERKDGELDINRECHISTFGVVLLIGLSTCHDAFSSYTILNSNAVHFRVSLIPKLPTINAVLAMSQLK